MHIQGSTCCLQVRPFYAILALRPAAMRAGGNLAQDKSPRSPSFTLQQLDSGIERLRWLREADLESTDGLALLDDVLDGLAGVRSDLLQILPRENPAIALQGEPAFRALAENAPDMIARFDAYQRYLYVNPIIEEMTGFSAQAFLGKTNYELGLPQSLSALWERELARVLKTGQQGRFQFDTPSPDGERYYDARLAPEPGCGDVIESVLAIVRDVTEQERTRRTLQRHAGRLHFLHQVNQAIRAARSAEEVAVAVLPYSQQLLDCSRATVSLFDREAGEALLLAVYTGHETRLGKGARLPIEWEWFVEDLEQGKICTIKDLHALESPAGTLQVLRDEGVQSLVSVPLIVQEKLIGSLNLGLPALSP